MYTDRFDPAPRLAVKIAHVTPMPTEREREGDKERETDTQKARQTN